MLVALPIATKVVYGAIRRPDCQKAVRSFMNGQGVFVSLQTGSGSLRLFQMPTEV